MTVSCQTCLAFAEVVDIAPEHGQCRRHAPVPQAAYAAIWPTVSATDWCVEHRSIDAPNRLTLLPNDPASGAADV